MSEKIAKWLESAGLSVSSPFIKKGHCGSAKKHGWELMTGTDCYMPVEKFRKLYEEVESLRAQLAAQQSAEPVAWTREWEGDVSDLGNMIVVFNEDEKDGSTNWFPLYAHAQPVAAIDEREEYRQWLGNLTGEQKYNFDSEGRGYPKDPQQMMWLAWQARAKLTTQKELGL